MIWGWPVFSRHSRCFFQCPLISRTRASLSGAELWSCCSLSSRECEASSTGAGSVETRANKSVQEEQLRFTWYPYTSTFQKRRNSCLTVCTVCEAHYRVFCFALSTEAGYSAETCFQRVTLRLSPLSRLWKFHSLDLMTQVLFRPFTCSKI